MIDCQIIPSPEDYFQHAIHPAVLISSVVASSDNMTDRDVSQPSKLIHRLIIRMDSHFLHMLSETITGKRKL